MDLATVRFFLAVAEHGHVTHAAEELNISQPGLSRALARLEREVGVPLFDREGRNVRLNRYGDVFREHARRLVAEEESARRALQRAADPDSGEISLAFLRTQGSLLVPDLLRRYRAERPNVTFRLAQDSAERMAGMLRDGDADLAITSPRPDDLAWHPLATERLLLAVPADHPLHGTVRLSAVADEPFIALRPGYGLRTIAVELFRRVGLRPAIAFEGDDTATVRGFVAAGLGVAILPKHPGLEVRYLPIDDPHAERTIGLAWVEGRTRPPVVERFRRFVIQGQPSAPAR